MLTCGTIEVKQVLRVETAEWGMLLLVRKGVLAAGRDGQEICVVRSCDRL